MSEYTPPTVAVRNAYVIANRPPLGTTPKPELEAEFDRWLESVKAQVWDEGCLHGSAYPYGKHGLTVDDNPYRKKQLSDIEFTFTPEETRRAMCEKCPTPHLVTYAWGHINDNPEGPKVLAISPDCQNNPKANQG